MIADMSLFVAQCRSTMEYVHVRFNHFTYDVPNLVNTLVFIICFIARQL